MKTKLEEIKRASLEAIANSADAAELEALRIKYLGKKGELTAVLKQMGGLSAEERPIIGQVANEVREALTEAIAARQAFKYPKGYYSIKDKVGVLAANPETAIRLCPQACPSPGNASYSLINNTEGPPPQTSFVTLNAVSISLKFRSAENPCCSRNEISNSEDSFS